ncbi:GGDEF domain-containing protein [Wenzhouxiangella sp. EGI_FJ10409]|uniref:GGDEF domain-containing protein n=1 Tax=Wenzhouxiangella sp. EGI_FJ10409 TaxID=3243767 RepID=UPI0035DE20D4
MNLDQTQPESSPDQKLAVRLYRLRMAMLAWAVSTVLTVAAWALGLLDVGFVEMGVLVLIVLVSQLFFHVALRSGWSQRWRDPSMTLAHILVAIMVGLWIISKAGEARTILLMLFIMAAFFGAFELRHRQFMLVALVAVAGYTIITVRDLITGDIDSSSQVVILELLGFAALMVWLAWFGSHIAEMRRKLGRRNRELRELSERLRHLAEHDELTGLPNRRRLISRLEAVTEASRSSGASFCVAVLDLDHFKIVNDEHGHQAGDEVLTQLAQRATHLLRGADALLRVDDTVADIGRFGGEEFLLILPDTELSGAGLAAERLRREIGDTPFSTSAGPITCTASIGVAEYQPGEAVHRTISRADEALYAAKSAGRNRVKTA